MKNVHGTTCIVIFIIRLLGVIIVDLVIVRLNFTSSVEDLLNGTQRILVNQAVTTIEHADNIKTTSDKIIACWIAKEEVIKAQLLVVP